MPTPTERLSRELTDEIDRLDAITAYVEQRLTPEMKQAGLGDACRSTRETSATLRESLARQQRDPSQDELEFLINAARYAASTYRRSSKQLGLDVPHDPRTRIALQA